MKYSQAIAVALVSVPAVYAASSDNPYATYPSVAHSASINGFADPIYSQLPSCAQSCVEQSTSNTPCPYWDTGCLCVMPQFEGPVAECIASQCKGNDVSVATSLANSICSSAGVYSPYWIIPSSLSPVLASAADNTGDAAPSTSADATTTGPTTSATADESTAPITSAPVTSAPVTSAAESSEQAQASSEPAQESQAESSAAPAESAAAESSAQETVAAESTAESTEAAQSSAPAESSSAAAPSSVVQGNSGNNNLPALVASVAGVFAVFAMFV